jgi:hypothetical protein
MRSFHDGAWQFSATQGLAVEFNPSGRWHLNNGNAISLLKRELAAALARPKPAFTQISRDRVSRLTFLPEQRQVERN